MKEGGGENTRCVTSMSETVYSVLRKAGPAVHRVVRYKGLKHQHLAVHRAQHDVHEAVACHVVYSSGYDMFKKPCYERG